MNTKERMRRAVLTACAMISSTAAAAGPSTWVFVGPDGRLAYRRFGNGNRMTDFSHAGYRGGGVAIPNVAVKATVNPSGGDDTPSIQNAIDAVSALPAANGFRGAVLLGRGTFTISGSLFIRTSGVVLRGSGMGEGGTVLKKTAAGATIEVEGVNDRSFSNKVAIRGAFIPAGSVSFSVMDASAYRVGDQVVVNRVVTAEWVHFVKMDTLVRNGRPQTWLGVGTTLRADRVIKAISGNTITLDCPLVDSYDSAFLGTPLATLEKYAFPGRISQVGVERLRIVGPAPGASGHALDFAHVMDGWAREVHAVEGRNTINIDDSKRVTFHRVISENTVRNTNSAAPADFSTNGSTQILYDRCEARSTGVWAYLTGARGTGPIVVLNSSSRERGLNPHHRWTVGMLGDGGDIRQIDFSNRRTGGSGHGWTTGWSVAWNLSSSGMTNEAAPGTTNWVIGCSGTPNVRAEPQGTYESVGGKVELRQTGSLYLEQLRDRLGDQALANIGYGDGFQGFHKIIARHGDKAVWPHGGATPNDE